MQETPVASHHSERQITRRNLLSSLLIGLALGIVAGAPIGWFAHRIYAQQHTAQVLLCRQQSFGLAEADLQARCGTPY